MGIRAVRNCLLSELVITAAAVCRGGAPIEVLSSKAAAGYTSGGQTPLMSPPRAQQHCTWSRLRVGAAQNARDRCFRFKSRINSLIVSLRFFIALPAYLTTFSYSEIGKWLVRDWTESDWIMKLRRPISSQIQAASSRFLNWFWYVMGVFITRYWQICPKIRSRMRWVSNYLNSL